MANRFWRGGSGTWNSSSTTNWSATSGGLGGASVPTAADSVFFDTNSSGTNAYTVTISGAVTCLDITVSARTPTFSGTGTPTISGSMSLVAGTVWSGTGLITFNATAAKTIATAGLVFASSGMTFNGVGGSWQLQNSISFSGASQAITLTAGTLDLNGNAITAITFTSSNANVRTLAFGAGSITLSGANPTWNTATVTNMTVTGTPNVVIAGTTAATITTGTPTEAQSINFRFSSGSYVLNPLTFTVCRDLSFTGFSGTVSLSNLTIYGGLTLASTASYTASGSVTWTFAATSGVKTITGNGVSFDSGISFNGIGGTWQLQDAFTNGPTTAPRTTLVNGTLDLNGKTLTVRTFATGGGTACTIAFGTGSITATGSGGNLWSIDSTTTTTTGTQVVNISNNTATASTVSSGSLNEANSISYNFTTGTYALTNTIGSKRNVNFTGFSGSVNNTAQTIYGNLTLSATASHATGSNACTFAATSGVKTITSNGNSMNCPAIFNGAGGTWQLQDAFSTNGSATHTNGTIDLNGKTFTVGNNGTYTTAAGTKNLTFNAGTLVCTGSLNNAAPTGFSTTAGTGTGSITMTGVGFSNFTGGGSTYNCNLVKAASGTLTITGANTFNDISNTTQPITVTFPAGVTTTFVNGFSLTGTAGNLVTINSTVAGTQATITKGLGIVACDYLSIRDSAASGLAVWYAGNHSTNVSNNTGWIFTGAPGNYAITAVFGSYSVSGQTANLTKGRVLTAFKGSYALTGQTATVSRSKYISASQGDYGTTGFDASILRNRAMFPDSGSYALTGQTATVSRSKYISASQGSYALTGQTASLTRNRMLNAIAGAYSLAGQSASLIMGRLLQAQPGSYAVAGQGISLSFGRLLSAQNGVYSVAGQAVDISVGIPPTPVTAIEYFVEIRSFTERRRF